MSKFLMNSPVLTGWGKFQFSPCSIEQAREFISDSFTSAIGHQSTAELLSSLLGTAVPMNRIQVQTAPGDQVLVFRLKTRLQEGKVLSLDEIKGLDFEFGLLSHLE